LTGTTILVCAVLICLRPAAFLAIRREDEYQQGLAVAQTMPGPLAAQLAMWLGYLERGALGALLVAVPFVVPPFLIVASGFAGDGAFPGARGI
jgi:chromate transporter